MEEADFPSWLHRELKKRNWYQAELAYKANISPSHITNLITGARKPGPEAIEGIANAFGYPPQVVFRAAGLLPPEPGYTEIEEMIQHKVTLLDEGKQIEVLDFIEFLLSNPRG